MRYSAADNLVTRIPASFLPLTLRNMGPLSDDEFYTFCQQHRDLRVERWGPHQIEIMSPTGTQTGRLNTELVRQLANWHHQYRQGIVGESNTGYQLAPGVALSPDASWVSAERWAAVPAGRRRKFAPVCPDFIIELQSETDRPATLRRKMLRWLDHGTRLAWLVQPTERQVLIYRPGELAPAIHVGVDSVLPADEAVLPGFALDLRELAAILDE